MAKDFNDDIPLPSSLRRSEIQDEQIRLKIAKDKARKVSAARDKIKVNLASTPPLPLRIVTSKKRPPSKINKEIINFTKSSLGFGGHILKELGAVAEKGVLAVADWVRGKTADARARGKLSDQETAKYKKKLEDMAADVINAPRAKSKKTGPRLFLKP